MSRLIASLVIFTFIIVAIPSNIDATKMRSTAYRDGVMDLINAERARLKLNKLETDDKLCYVAADIAKDKATNYPDEVSPQLFTDKEYKDKMKNYSGFITLEVTYNDILVKLMKKEASSFTDEHLYNSFTDPKVGNTSALEPKLTNGCVAVSLEGVGAKPFAIFIGGVEKTTFDMFPLNILKSALMKLGLIK